MPLENNFAKILMILVVTQNAPLKVMASNVPFKSKRVSLAAPAYDKLSAPSVSVNDEIQIEKSLNQFKFDEADDEALTHTSAEWDELTELCGAALERSQDIRLVLNKLLPSKDPKHSTEILTHLLSTAMRTEVRPAAYGVGDFFTAEDFVEDRLASPKNRSITRSLKASMVMSVLNPSVNCRSLRKVGITETEAIMLYDMARSVNDKTVEAFHTYKSCFEQIERIANDEGLSKISDEVQNCWDTTKQMQLEYQLRKKYRELCALYDDRRIARELLVSLAGDEAVIKLDRQLSAKNGANCPVILAQ